MCDKIPIKLKEENVGKAFSASMVWLLTDQGDGC